MNMDDIRAKTVGIRPSSILTKAFIERDKSMAYESPIKINYQEGIPEFRTFHEEINEKIECRIMASVQEKMAIEINKEELIKALNYDRHQYEQGYEDAKKKFKAPDGQWIIKNGDKICPICMMGTMGSQNASVPFFHFCPYCGADLRKHKEEEEE